MADSHLALEVRRARSKVDQETGQEHAVRAALDEAEAWIAELDAQIELHDKAVALLTSIGTAAQQTAQDQVEQLVTRALQTIFDENLSFAIVPGTRAGQATADFVISSQASHAGQDALVETPVLDSRGGGMAVVVAFVLRLVVMLLTPGVRNTLFLDESFAHVSAEYEPRVAAFLREVADKADVQIVLITHSDAYSDQADKRYRLMLGPDGVTRWKED